VQVGLFMLGYAGIIFEESVAFNKSVVSLIMAAGLWTIRAFSAPDTAVAVGELSEQLSDVSEIVFFLMGAMTIVETVDAHQVRTSLGRTNREEYSDGKVANRDTKLGTARQKMVLE
jgi:Na+/H+ antiporter NhaD/arsenite permease-like protein